MEPAAPAPPAADGASGSRTPLGAGNAAIPEGPVRDDDSQTGGMTSNEEYNFKWVIQKLRELNDLLPPAPKTDRVQGPAIGGCVDDRPEPSASFALPRSGMMDSLIGDTNARLSLDNDSFREQKKVKGLLPPPWLRHRRYYEVQDGSTTPPTLNDSMSTLLKSPLDRVAKKDVSFSAAEARDLDGSTDSLCSVISWMDHWLNAFGRLALETSSEKPTIRRLLQSGGKALFFLARQANVMWANVRLKRRDTILNDLVSGCAPEDVAAIRNGRLDDSGHLFPEEVVMEVIEARKDRLESRVLQDAVYSSGKRRSSPARVASSSGSGRPPKNQRTSTAVGDLAPSSSTQDKGSSQPFSKPYPKGKGKKKGKAKK